jgi:hypothetical protein
VRRQQVECPKQRFCGVNISPPVIACHQLIPIFTRLSIWRRIQRFFINPRIRYFYVACCWGASVILAFPNLVKLHNLHEVMWTVAEKIPNGAESDF